MHNREKKKKKTCQKLLSPVDDDIGDGAAIQQKYSRFWQTMFVNFNQIGRFHAKNAASASAISMRAVSQIAATSKS